MKNYKLVHRKPYFPRRFGKAPRRKIEIKLTWGDILEAAVFIGGVAFLLWATFGGIHL